MGEPLIHIAFGCEPTGRPRTAAGDDRDRATRGRRPIAIGIMAAGIISVGIVAAGVFSIGIVAIGLAVACGVNAVWHDGDRRRGGRMESGRSRGDR